MSRNKILVAALVGMQAVALDASALCTAGNASGTIAETTPTGSFLDNGDGTVTHNLTGLMWKQCIQGLSGALCGTGGVTVMPWSDALVASVADHTGGYSDWRLPNKKELESIVETCGYTPSINQTVFPPSFVGYYWTSTSYARAAENAWLVNFSLGTSSYFLKSSSFAARLVRGGRPPASFDAAAAAVPAQTVVEYVDTADFPGSPGGHFFYSSDPAEQAAVDGGAAGQFARTGRQFKVGGTQTVCRFYGSISPGPNSHFFTVEPSECNALRTAQVTPTPTTAQQWNYEGIGFSTTPALVAGDGTRSCPSNTQPQYRAYNNAFPLVGPKNPWDSNHRYSASQADIAAMVAQGWRDEGIVFCSAL